MREVVFVSVVGCRSGHVVSCASCGVAFLAGTAAAGLIPVVVNPGCTGGLSGTDGLEQCVGTQGTVNCVDDGFLVVFEIGPGAARTEDGGHVSTFGSAVVESRVGNEGCFLVSKDFTSVAGLSPLFLDSDVSSMQVVAVGAGGRRLLAQVVAFHHGGGCRVIVVRVGDGALDVGGATVVVVADHIASIVGESVASGAEVVLVKLAVCVRVPGDGGQGSGVVGIYRTQSSVGVHVAHGASDVAIGGGCRFHGVPSESRTWIGE